jgi:hypothetical protein
MFSFRVQRFLAALDSRAARQRSVRVVLRSPYDEDDRSDVGCVRSRKKLFVEGED